MLAELDEVVRLMDAATPGEWFISRSAPYYQYQLSAKCGNESTRLFATMDAMPFDAPANQRTANAELVPSLVNWFRTHHATLADMAKRLEAAERDAARWRFVRAKIALGDASVFAAMNDAIPDNAPDEGPVIEGMLDDGVDAAIDATQEGAAG